jgi:hypothetical protein
MRTGIEFSTIMSIINSIPGIKTEDCKNWVKVFGKGGPDKARLYVAKQVKVRQIDLSAFGANFIGVLKPNKPNGAVEGHLDLDHEYVLEHLAMLCEGLAQGLFAATVKEKARPFSTSSPKSKEATTKTTSSPDNNEELVRLRRVVKIAEMKGVPVSEKTLARIAELSA